jgi:DNA-binding NarL/FixJ family response regulator
MKRVLFVDDDPLILSGLRRMLRDQRQEWEMCFACSGEDALRMLAEIPCDVVVSDMRMPQMDGAELLSRVRSMFPDTVRIVLSGQSDKEAILKCVGPAHQFLSKPCVPERLRETIQRACAVKGVLKSTELRTLVSQIDNLPSIPKVYERLISELRGPDVSIEDVANLIAADVGMTAKILQLVNSSFFGLPQRVTNLSHAVGRCVLPPWFASLCGIFFGTDRGPQPAGRHRRPLDCGGLLA